MYLLGTGQTRFSFELLGPLIGGWATTLSGLSASLFFEGSKEMADDKKLADVIVAKWTGANDCHDHHKRQLELEARLWSLLGEISSVNEYEYPYRMPGLQKRADELLNMRNEPDGPDAA